MVQRAACRLPETPRAANAKLLSQEEEGGKKINPLHNRLRLCFLSKEQHYPHSLAAAFLCSPRSGSLLFRSWGGTPAPMGAPSAAAPGPELAPAPPERRSIKIGSTCNSASGITAGGRFPPHPSQPSPAGMSSPHKANVWGISTEPRVWEGEIWGDSAPTATGPFLPAFLSLPGPKVSESRDRAENGNIRSNNIFQFLKKNK